MYFSLSNVEMGIEGLRRLAKMLQMNRTLEIIRYVISDSFAKWMFELHFHGSLCLPGWIEMVWALKNVELLLISLHTMTSWYSLSE